MKKITRLSFAFAILSLFAMLAFASCSNKSAEGDGHDSVVSSQSETQNGANFGDALEMKTDGRPMVVDFSATWCPPCQQLKPIYAKLTKEYEGKVTMITVDVDENKEMAAQFAVQSIPTLIFFDAEGKVVDRVTGFIGENELREKIEALK